MLSGGMGPGASAVKLAAYRAIEAVQHLGSTCPLTAPGIKVTASGRVLTTSCAGMRAGGPQCINPTTPYLVLNDVGYFELDDTARQVYTPVSSEACPRDSYYGSAV